MALSCYNYSVINYNVIKKGRPRLFFLFALKSEFQKSEENGEKRRKPEKISGFSVGIFFVNSSWRHHPESDRGMKVLQTSALPLGYGAV